MDIIHTNKITSKHVSTIYWCIISYFILFCFQFPSSLFFNLQQHCNTHIYTICCCCCCCLVMWWAGFSSLLLGYTIITRGESLFFLPLLSILVWYAIVWWLGCGAQTAQKQRQFFNCATTTKATTKTISDGHRSSVYFISLSFFLFVFLFVLLFYCYYMSHFKWFVFVIRVCLFLLILFKCCYSLFVSKVFVFISWMWIACDKIQFVTYYTTIIYIYHPYSLFF